MATYRTNASFIDDMGSIPSMRVEESSHETKEEQFLWHLNRMRDHDGLTPLTEVPEGIVFTEI